MYDIIEKQNRIYILEDEKLVEKYDTSQDINSVEGNIYIGKVVSVLMGIKSAFINIGTDKNGILPISDLEKRFDDVEIRNILKPR